ncbi:MAG: hypothetical protein MJZ70_01245 [Bacteroidales bacterium]|nr:hypothetical protein [Bacteroidales bacterium]
MERTIAPHAVAAMVWGGLSAVFSVIPLISVLGIVFGVFGMTYSVRGMKSYAKEPERYSCVGLLRAGKICSIAGMANGILLTILSIFTILFFPFN